MVERAAPGVHQTVNFSVLLRRLRTEAGLTQQELAERAGISVRGLSDLERGARRAPYIDTLERLAEGLELGERERAALISSGRRVGVSRLELSELSPPSLPVELTSFVGRETELAAVRRLLETTRLLTLSGGKVRSRRPP